MILTFCNVCVEFFFNQWHCLYWGHKPSHLFSPFQCRPSNPDYFYPAFHYHNKTHAWKTDKLKETGQPEIWIWEAYFHLSFLSFTLLCCSFLFAQRNRKRHAFSFSLCVIMVLFRSALLCDASLDPHTSIAGQPVDYPDPCQNSNRTTNHSRTHPCQVGKNALICAAKEPCQD